MPNIRMVCLANSRKLGGRCIAGIDLDSGEWIRPVNDGGGELSLYDINYQDGSTPQVLDIIDVPVIQHQPLYYQPENWVIDPEYYWTKVGELPVSELASFCLKPTYILEGRTDRLSETQVRSIINPPSLLLINVKQICLVKTTSYTGSQQLRAFFEYNGITYNLVVTDKKIENRFLDKKVDYGQYTFKGNIYLTISLGEQFYGYHYKLVASIICLDKTESRVLDITP